MELVWSDEFNAGQVAGAYVDVDPAKWRVMHNSWGKPAGALEAYTPRQKNVRLTPWGTLELAAYPEAYTPPPGGGDPQSYTSGRIESLYYVPPVCRVEARIMLPGAKSKGATPSFWMRGDGTWPFSGEVDVLEAINDTPFVSHAVHGADGAGQHRSVQTIHYTQPDFREGWHVYRMDRTASLITFAVDGIITGRIERGALPPAIFDGSHFLIFGMGIGGSWAGAPAADNVWPIKQIMDWVRVYA